jgi:hypothetical protein
MSLRAVDINAVHVVTLDKDVEPKKRFLVRTLTRAQRAILRERISSSNGDQSRILAGKVYDAWEMLVVGVAGVGKDVPVAPGEFGPCVPRHAVAGLGVSHIEAMEVVKKGIDANTLDEQARRDLSLVMWFGDYADSLDCETCLAAGDQVDRGCEADGKFEHPFHDNSAKHPSTTLRCPRGLIAEVGDQVREVLTAYRLRKADGEWPNAGGMFGQPAVLRDAFCVCSEVEAAGVYKG